MTVSAAEERATRRRWTEARRLRRAATPIDFAAVASRFVGGGEATGDGRDARGEPAPVGTEAATPTLPRDWTSTWLVLLTACAMAFLAGLALAVAAGADALAKSWTSDLSRTLTVSIDLDGRDAASDRARVADALLVIRAVPGVEAARALSDAEVDALLAPWLGDGLATGTATDPGAGIGLPPMPLPALLDVAATEPQAAERVADALAGAGLPALVDAHGEWAERLEPAAARVRGLAQAGLIVIAIAAGAMTALACATALAAQRSMVDVLRLVGAADGFVARIFVRRFQALAFAGAAAGAGAAAVALALGAPPDTLDNASAAPLLPDLTPDAQVWAQLAALPLAFALIATAAAWSAAMLALRRSDG